MNSGEFRDARICEFDIEVVEDAIAALYRAGEFELPPKLMVLALRLRTSTGFSPELPSSNVVELADFSKKVS